MDGFDGLKSLNDAASKSILFMVTMLNHPGFPILTLKYSFSLTREREREDVWIGSRSPAPPKTLIVFQRTLQRAVWGLVFRENIFSTFPSTHPCEYSFKNQRRGGWKKIPEKTNAIIWERHVVSWGGGRGYKEVSQKRCHRRPPRLEVVAATGKSSPSSKHRQPSQPGWGGEVKRLSNQLTRSPGLTGLRKRKAFSGGGSREKPPPPPLMNSGRLTRSLCVWGEAALQVSISPCTARREIKMLNAPPLMSVKKSVLDFRVWAQSFYDQSE